MNLTDIFSKNFGQLCILAVEEAASDTTTPLRPGFELGTFALKAASVPLHHWAKEMDLGVNSGSNLFSFHVMD